MILSLSGALLAGLLGSPHCVAMCGGLATAASGSRAEAVAYHAGRLGTYAILGGLAGGLGAAMPGPPWISIAISAIFLLFFALRLAGWSPGLPVSGRLHGLVALAARPLRRRGWASRLAFGAVNGLLPCGLLYAALALAVAAGGAAAGAGVMLVFGLGTVPALATASAGLRKLSARSPATRRVLAALVLVAGLGALAWRSPLHAGVGADGAPACHQAR